jgi:hypothetical protein
MTQLGSDEQEKYNIGNAREHRLTEVGALKQLCYLARRLDG